MLSSGAGRCISTSCPSSSSEGPWYSRDLRSPCHSAYGFSPNTTTATSGLSLEAAVDTDMAVPPAAATLLANPFVDGGGAREVGVGIAGSLPRDGPPAALFADVIGAIAGNEHVGLRGQRQQAIVILEQHDGLANRLACHRAMLRRAELRGFVGQRPGRGPTLFKQSCPQLHRRIRVTASSIRDMGMSPARTCATVFCRNDFH